VNVLLGREEDVKGLDLSKGIFASLLEKYYAKPWIVFLIMISNPIYHGLVLAG
jgi:hypothetical protein